MIKKVLEFEFDLIVVVLVQDWLLPSVLQVMEQKLQWPEVNKIVVHALLEVVSLRNDGLCS